MSVVDIVLIAFALALDAFAVSVGAGAFFGRATGRQRFRLSFHFGLFQFFMPIIGWSLGRGLVDYISSFDHWIAFAILGFIGFKMIETGVKHSSESISKDISRGVTLVSLAVATSIDALAVGFSLGLFGQEILFPCVVIGIVAAAMTLLGIKFGEKLSSGFGDKAQIAGGIVLILIGLEIVFEHLELF